MGPVLARVPPSLSEFVWGSSCVLDRFLHGAASTGAFWQLCRMGARPAAGRRAFGGFIEAQRICVQFFCGELLVGGFAGRFGEKIVRLRLPSRIYLPFEREHGSLRSGRRFFFGSFFFFLGEGLSLLVAPGNGRKTRQKRQRERGARTPRSAD
jgi:hypothetical protein